MIAAGETIETVSTRLRFLPPAGLLPREALSPRAGVNRFFPDWYVIEALPVPEEQLDLVLQESAMLNPFDRFSPDRVRILVPVPQQLYDPHLLEIMTVPARPAPTLASARATAATAASGSRPGPW